MNWEGMSAKELGAIPSKLRVGLSFGCRFQHELLKTTIQHMKDVLEKLGPSARMIVPEAASHLAIMEGLAAQYPAQIAAMEETFGVTAEESAELDKVMNDSRATFSKIIVERIDAEARR